jgi:hypothetical protein
MAPRLTGTTAMPPGPSDVPTALLEAKAQRAKTRGHIRVFLSHKQKDYNAAKVIHEILELKSAEKIKVSMSENIEKGDDWQMQIEKEL